MPVKSVVESVAELLRREIITGQLSSGAKLNEIELSDRIGISRSPLREAFRKLEHENLVISIPRKGVYVAGMSIKDCEEVYRARQFIECSVVDIICEKGVTELPFVEKAFDMSTKVLVPNFSEGQEMLEYYHVMSGFHKELVKSCQNKWIIHFYNDLSLHLARYQVLYLNTPGVYQLSLNDHSHFLSLIKASSYAEAKEFLSLHITEALHRVKKRISQTNMPKGGRINLDK